MLHLLALVALDLKGGACRGRWSHRTGVIDYSKNQSLPVVNPDGPAHYSFITFFYPE